MVSTVRAVVCLSLWLSVSQISGSHIPPRMNKTIQSLLQDYKLSASNRFNGKPVFSREPLTGKLETKMVFLGAVLETYEKLIGSMLKQLPTPSPASAVTATPSAGSDAGSEAGGDVRTKLIYILSRVQELKKHHYQEEEKLLAGLQDLRHIKMDDRVVQSKALWELSWLYEEASSLPTAIKMQRRRRRQAKAKSRPRA